MRNPDQLQELAAAMEHPLELYLKFKEIVDRYERGAKTIYARAFLRSEGKSVRERELKAYADEEYVKYQDEWHEASKKCISARVKYENLENQFNALQSGLSYDREHMKRFQ